MDRVNQKQIVATVKMLVNQFEYECGRKPTEIILSVDVLNTLMNIINPLSLGNVGCGFFKMMNSIYEYKLMDIPVDIIFDRENYIGVRYTISSPIIRKDIYSNYDNSDI